MAQAPTVELIKEAQEHSQNAIDEKIKAQQAIGKDFVIDEHGHAAGVIPEEVWKGMKS